jgi:hypothetical protein
MYMEKTIIEKLKMINATVETELAAAKMAALANPALSTESSLAKRLSNLAFQAIMGGPTSAEWKNYMQEIVGLNAPEQLKRLTFNDNLATKDYVIESNVYIVANAVCGSQTRTNTLNNVKIEGPDFIDKDLPPEP